MSSDGPWIAVAVIVVVAAVELELPRDSTGIKDVQCNGRDESDGQKQDGLCADRCVAEKGEVRAPMEGGGGR